jgi:stage II sporulation SpoAA-like protein
MGNKIKVLMSETGTAVTQADNNARNDLLRLIKEKRVPGIGLSGWMQFYSAGEPIDSDIGPWTYALNSVDRINLSFGKRHMPLQITPEPNDIYVMQISGVLKRSEFAANQKDVAHKIDIGSKPRILAILENFEGWERGADWNDLDFLITHSDQIAKIAIVADPTWEQKALAFAGAGVRHAPVRFFPPNELAEARSWIANE